LVFFFKNERESSDFVLLNWAKKNTKKLTNLFLKTKKNGIKGMTTARKNHPLDAAVNL